jgi:hypothetical protein
LVLVRDILLILVIARQSRLCAGVYVAAAAVAFLCLLASQRGYDGLSDAAKTIAPVAAFGIPLAALLVAQWRHPVTMLLCGGVIVAGVFVSSLIVPGILRGDTPPAIPLAEDAPLEAWWPYFKGAERERVIVILQRRPELERDLIGGMSSRGPLEILHTFDLISALEPPPTPALRGAFRMAQARLATLATAESETAWRIRTRQAAETLGEPVP